MDNLNNIPSQGNFGNIANILNQNFSTIKVAIGQVEYSTTKCRGMYASATALGNVVPSPKVGDWALVGQSFPAAIYVCNTADTWTNSGNTYSGDNVSFNDYVTQTSFATYQAQVGAAIDALNGYFASGGVVAGHTAAIGDLYDILQERTEAIEGHTEAINDLQEVVGENGLGKRMDDAETNIGNMHTDDIRQDEYLALHNTAIQNLQSDVRYIRAAIDMIGPGEGGGTDLSIQAMTQEAYDALETYDANTLYLII